MDKLTKRSSGKIECSNKPYVSLDEAVLRFRLRYRAEMGDLELADWLETLTMYPLQEVLGAMDYLMRNPPKQVLPDGTTQEWRGMPSLVDITQTIDNQREEGLTEYRRKEGQRMAAEMRDLKRRRDAGEPFYGLADVLRTFKAPDVLKPMPNIRTVWPDIDPDRNRAKLEQQKRDLGIS